MIVRVITGEILSWGAVKQALHDYHLQAVIT